MTTSSRNILQYKNVQCYFCNESFNEDLFIEHIRLCGAVLESCPQKCGAYVARKSLKTHKRFCLKRVRFDERNLQTTKQRMENNNDQDDDEEKNIENINWREHVFSMLGRLKNSVKIAEDERDKIMENSWKTIKRLEEIEGATKNIRLTILGDSESVRQRFISYDKQLKSLDNCVAEIDNKTHDTFENVAYRLDVIQGSVINERNKQQIVSDNLEKNIQELRDTLTNERDLISDIWNEHKTRMNDLKLELEMRCKKIQDIDDKCDIVSEKIDILVDELRKHSSCIIQQEHATKKLKIQMKETIKCLEELALKESSVSNDLSRCHCSSQQQQQVMMNGVVTSGRLLWRIDRYKEKMTLAKENNEALLSPIFFNKEYGYALQMEIYLNGRDRWKDRNIIGCLKVVEGAWDPLLDWPCVLRATVTLRDQDNPANNIRKIVKTKAKVDHYDKNRASNGIQCDTAIDMFIPHTTLTRHDGFIKNNIIFLDIQVTELHSSLSTSSLIF